MGSTSSTERLPWSTRLAYAAPAAGLAAFGLPIFVFLPKFYTDVVGVPVAAVGALFLGGRVFDAVTDPAIGMASDRTRGRWGRRRPWLAIGAFPLAAALLALLAPPASLSAAGATAWLGVALFVAFLVWTAVAVPYEALGAEVTADYDERTRLLGMRDGALLLGVLLAAVAPTAARAVLFHLGWTEGPALERAAMLSVAAAYGPLIIGSCLWCAAVVPEGGGAAPTSWGKLGEVWRNKPFVRLLLAYTVAALASNLPSVMLAFFVEEVLAAGKTAVGVYLLIYLTSAVLALPLWIRLAARTEKRDAWIAATLIHNLCFLPSILLGPGDTTAFGVICLLSGAGFGATLALPSAMQADAIDVDELATGERREGLYVGLWAISRKMAAALSFGIAFPLLQWAGYTAGGPQPTSALWAIRALYIVVPVVFNLAAIAILVGYRLDRAACAEVRAQLDGR